MILGDKRAIINDIMETKDRGVYKLLSDIHDTLSLQNQDVKYRYSIIKMFYDMVKDCEDDIDSIRTNLIDGIREGELSTFIELSRRYQWWPEEILELRDMLDKSITGHVDKKTVLDSINEEYNKIQVANYRFTDKATVLTEFRRLKNELESYTAQRDFMDLYMDSLEDTL